MVSPIVQSTLQACVLTAVSNVMAQCISAYRTDSSYVIDWTPVFQFVLYTALTCPPNYLMQEYFEYLFPGQFTQPSASAVAAAAAGDEKELNKEQASGEILETRLNVTNTIIKLILDQTVSAGLNTITFLLYMAGTKGANLEQAVQITKQDFWPLMKAGYRLWPFVSFINYSVVRTVETRTLVGNLAGMGWGVYLSLVAGGK